MMLVEGEDYYINEDGLFVFTKEYHLKRGFCCQNKCLHCPGIMVNPKKPSNLKNKSASLPIAIIRIGIMRIEEEIQTTNFEDNYHKAVSTLLIPTAG